MSPKHICPAVIVKSLVAHHHHRGEPPEKKEEEADEQVIQLDQIRPRNPRNHHAENTVARVLDHAGVVAVGNPMPAVAMQHGGREGVAGLELGGGVLVVVADGVEDLGLHLLCRWYCVSASVCPQRGPRQMRGKRCVSRLGYQCAWSMLASEIISWYGRDS